MQKMFKNFFLKVVFASFILPVYLSAGELNELNHDELIFSRHAKIQTAVNGTAVCVCLFSNFTDVQPMLLAGNFIGSAGELIILGKASYNYHFGAIDQNEISRKQIVIRTMQLAIQSLASTSVLVNSKEMGCAYFLFAAANSYLGENAPWNRYLLSYANHENDE